MAPIPPSRSQSLDLCQVPDNISLILALCSRLLGSHQIVQQRRSCKRNFASDSSHAIALVCRLDARSCGLLLARSHRHLNFAHLEARIRGDMASRSCTSTKKEYITGSQRRWNISTSSVVVLSSPSRTQRFWGATHHRLPVEKRCAETNRRRWGASAG